MSFIDDLKSFNINMDEFEKWLTSELLETAFHNAGFDVELKEEFKKEG